MRFRAKPTLLWPRAARLGETPIWIAERCALYFIDGLRGNLCQTDSSATVRREVQIAPELGFIVRRNAGALLYGTGLQIRTHELDTGASSAFATLPGDPSTLRLNDAKWDGEGLLWTGSMDRQGSRPIGSLYCVSADGEPSVVDEGYAIPNGFAFTKQGSELYVADSPLRVVYRYSVQGRRLTDRVAWLRLGEQDGYPDGMTADSSGHLWVALYGGGCVRRYRPDATIEREIRFPTPNVTACCFGGEDESRLFVTTAEESPQRGWIRWRRPRGGSLFRLDWRSSRT